MTYGHPIPVPNARITGSDGGNRGRGLTSCGSSNQLNLTQLMRCSPLRRRVVVEEAGWLTIFRGVGAMAVLVRMKDNHANISEDDEDHRMLELRLRVHRAVRVHPSSGHGEMSEREHGHQHQGLGYSSNHYRYWTECWCCSCTPLREATLYGLRVPTHTRVSDHELQH